MRPRLAVFGVKGLPAFGGASCVGENLVNQLKDKYDYTIYAIDTHTDKRGIYNGYYQKSFKGYKGKRINTFMYYIKSMFHALFIGQYDIIHIHHTSSGFILPLLRLKYKIVATAHGILPESDNKWNKIDKFLFNISAHLFFRFSNCVISVSKPHIQIFKKYTNKEILYVPNGVNTNSENVLRVHKEEYIVFAASRIISIKGGHTFLEALKILDFKGESIIIGSLDHTSRYKKKLLSMVENRNIQFTGLIKEKDKLFNLIRRAKIFVFPSFNEGMSNMLLEVASLKTPIICSDIPENKIIFNDLEVLYFKTGDSKDLAKKIKWAFDNYSFMIDRAERAFSKMNNNYQWSDIAHQYDKIFDSLLNEKQV